MANPYSPSQPPTGHFSVWQRVFRGYGPLAVLAAFVLVVALLVPSKPQAVNASSSSNGSTDAYGSPTGSAAGTGTAGSAGQAATAGSAGSKALQEVPRPGPGPSVAAGFLPAPPPARASKSPTTVIRLHASCLPETTVAPPRKE
jgi:hypothetical protein